MTPVFGLYTHIRANRIRSVLLLAGLFVLVLVVGWAVALALLAAGDASGAPAEVLVAGAFATVLPVTPFLALGTLAWIGIAVALNTRIVAAATGARTITREDDGGDFGGGDGDDPLYDRAVAVVAQAGYCSISHIQRQLSVGYNKAAKLVEQMESEGVVGPASSKAGGRREVLIQAQ